MEASVQPEKKSRLRRWLQHLRNPVTVKELRSRMRGRRAFVVLVIYLLLMSGFITLVYMAFLSSSSGPGGADTRELGKVIFASVVGVQGFLVLFVGPSFTAGAISGEKERQTYDLLRTTLLSASEFVMGKLLSALSYVLLLILAAVPLQSFAFLLGGVSLLELFLSQVILMVAAVAVAMYGLYSSARMRTTLGASVVTFAGILLLTFGLPAVVMLFTMILGPLLYSGASTISPVWELLAAYGLLFLAGWNLPATLIVSDLFLVQEGALFYWTDTIGGYTVYLVSPWLPFLVIYSLLALLFYKLTVRRVRKIANK